MDSITINIPDKIDKKQFLQGINIILENPELIEDFLLGVKMSQIKYKDKTKSIKELKKNMLVKYHNQFDKDLSKIKNKLILKKLILKKLFNFI